MSDSNDGWGRGIYSDETLVPSQVIVETAAEELGASPTELPPLYDSIDAEALDQLVQSCAGVNVGFRYCGFDVTVERGGDVVLSSD